MHETTHYPVTDARNKLSSLINRAVKDGERIVLDLHGLPAVVLVPVSSERVMMDAFLDSQARNRETDARRIATEETLRLAALKAETLRLEAEGRLP